MKTRELHHQLGCLIKNKDISEAEISITEMSNGRGKESFLSLKTKQGDYILINLGK